MIKFLCNFFFLIKKCILFPILFIPMISHAAKNAVVIVESAIVYSKASFDSPPIGTLELNEKVRVSNQTHGPFYKVKSKGGLLGYISDVDVKVEGVAHPSEKSGWNEDGKSNETPFPLRLFVGPVVSITKYEEKVRGQEYNNNVMMWGLRMSGPLKIFKGSPLMFDGVALIHLSVPKYYNKLSTSKLNSKGCFTITNLSMKWPVMVFSDLKGLVTFQFGGLIAYSHFSGLQPVSLPVRELRAGILLGVEVSRLLMKNILLSINPRYYIERSKYLSFELALQYGF